MHYRYKNKTDFFKRKVRNIRQIILGIIFVLAAFSFLYLYNINSSADVGGADETFLVSPGEGVNEISSNLSSQNLIKSEFFFKFYIWLNKDQRGLQAGEYILSPKMNITEIVDKLVRGQALERETKVVIYEGWTLENIANYFEKIGMFPAQEFLKATGYPKIDYRQNKNLPLPPDYSEKFSFLADKPEYVSLEGYLFPDTYRFFKKATPQEVVEKMLSNFDQKLTPDLRSEIAKQGKTIYEIITMASIVEKEVRKEADMKIVSGIFWSRLQYGQALQSDATLGYALNDNEAAHKFSDLQLDSLFNSYKYQGLPPTPISNPGLRAIKAAIYPQDSNYNYFLNAKESGETIFSRTYQEHLENKRIYLD